MFSDQVILGFESVQSVNRYQHSTRNCYIHLKS